MSEQSFLKKIEEHKGIILKVVRMYADDPEDRKDLQQEIIYQSWKSYPDFKGDARLSTWLYKVSLNVSLTYISKKRKSVPVNTADEEPHYVNHELSERADQLYRAIKQLNEIDRGIIMLHLDGYDNTEISDITGISKNNAGVKLHRIKQQLTTTLTKK